MDHNKWLNFLEQHEDLVDDDNWDDVYDVFNEDYNEAVPLTNYLHKLGFDPLPYMTSIPDSMYSGCTWLDKITIPDGVKSIGYSAFEDCTELTSVTIPDSVESIDVDAFNSCSRLPDIKIPDSVTKIGDGAFAVCSGLTSITFAGTKSQLDGIEKGKYWNYDVTAEVVHCSDGDVKL